MRAIFVLFDSLNRLMLGAYGGALPTPNFDRFAKRAITFDTHYVGSLPCMPARRDMHTGRLNFPHRSWGPLEPFDVWYDGFQARSAYDQEELDSIVRQSEDSERVVREMEALLRTDAIDWPAEAAGEPVVPPIPAPPPSSTQDSRQRVKRR